MEDIVLVDYTSWTFVGHEEVHIKYDLISGNVQFSYKNLGVLLKDYQFDYDFIRSFLTVDNIQEFFKRRLYKYSDFDRSIMPTERPVYTIKLKYKDRERTISLDDIYYTLKPIVLLEKLMEYNQVLRTYSLTAL